MDRELYSELGKISLRSRKRREAAVNLLDLHGFDEIEQLANLALMTNFTVSGKDSTYFYVKTETGVVIRTYLPPEMCEQYLVTNIALEMKRTGVLDFAAILRFVLTKDHDYFLNTCTMFL